MKDNEESRDEGDGPEGEPLKLGDCSDVCKALLERYGRSSAPQHRRLCAAVAAMRSILLEEGLPLIPSAYFAAVVTAIRDSEHTDPGALAALGTLLAILLPLTPVESLTPHKSRDAALVLAALLKNQLATALKGTMRSAIASMGFLMLHVDLDDWNAVVLPLETLMGFTVDKRPKIRRCAQLSAEKFFKALKHSTSKRMASNFVHCFYDKYINIMGKPDLKELVPENKIPFKSESLEVLYMLNMITNIVPYISGGVKLKIFLDAYKSLDCHYSMFTRHILGLLDTLLVTCKVEKLFSESENILAALYLCISTAKENNSDIVVSALKLVIKFLDKLIAVEPNAWTGNLPLIFTSVTGLLRSSHVCKDVIDVFMGIINSQGVHNIFMSSNHFSSLPIEITSEKTALISICTQFENILKTCDAPSVFILHVISAIILKLGESSYVFMKNVIVKLSKLAKKEVVDVSVSKQLQACIGASIIAMGPEKVLMLIPLSLHVEKSSVTNTWMIPILQTYAVGSSLPYFVEHIAPLAKSIEIACNKSALKISKSKRLQRCAHNLWNLLPSFSRYPIDTSQSFQSVSSQLIVALREVPMLHEIICISLQELVNGNKNILNQDSDNLTNLTIGNFCVEVERIQSHFSKEVASRNIEAIALGSLDLLQALIDIFLESPAPEKRNFLKNTIRSLSSVSKSEKVQNLFISLLDKLELVGDLSGPKPLDCQTAEISETKSGNMVESKSEEMRCLVLELSSSFVEAADQDFINIIFNFVRTSLISKESCRREAYCILSKILEVHKLFVFSRTNEIIDLLCNLKEPTDFGTLEDRFSCFYHLLVYIIRGNNEQLDTKAFIVLNEIILTLKSKKESRKLAYDLLVRISSCLKLSQASEAESDLQRLFLMVMGYLSSSSPHIIGGAISALSLLVYYNASFCLVVPNLIPSILVLLEKKDIEVIKAALGFVKVLASSLSSDDLCKLLPDILEAILPWSAVSKHHFRSKVGVILEIISRKCGCNALNKHIPSKYKYFMKSIIETHLNKRKPKNDEEPRSSLQSADAIAKRGEKRGIKDLSIRRTAISKSPDGQKRKKQKTDI